MSGAHRAGECAPDHVHVYIATMYIVHKQFTVKVMSKLEFEVMISYNLVLSGSYRTQSRHAKKLFSYMKLDNKAIETLHCRYALATGKVC